MKTLQLAIVFIVSIASFPVVAQNESDVLRLSQTFTGGTARAIGMGGAFGALGGDMTSLSINPAGIGVYRASEFTFTPALNVDNTKSSFYGSSYADSKYTLNLNNIGYVFTLNTNKDEGWVSSSFGITYNRLNDFNRNATVVGTNTKSSMLDEFTTVLNNNYLGNKPITTSEYNNMSVIESDLLNNYNYYEYLAYKTMAIYPDNPNGGTVNPGYFINDMQNEGQYNEKQRRTITTKGGIGEWAFSVGANYSHKLYLGATIGIDPVYYEEVKSHTESQIPGNYLSDFTFNDYFKTSGTGYNIKLGIIYKPIDLIRLGFALHSPTFYALTSEFNSSMVANYRNGPDYNDTTQLHFSQAASALAYDYTINSPLKLITSIAFQFKQFGVLSIDYEYLDYSKSKIRADGDPFTDVNESVRSIYKPTGNLKIGAEAKLGDFALRAGLGYYGSPYKSDQFNKDASTTSYSFGFGYRGKSFFLDFGYILLDTKYKYKLYSYQNFNTSGSTPVNELADMSSKTGKFVTTLGFRF